MRLNCVISVALVEYTLLNEKYYVGIYVLVYCIILNAKCKCKLTWICLTEIEVKLISDFEC